MVLPARLRRRQPRGHRGHPRPSHRRDPGGTLSRRRRWVLWSSACSRRPGSDPHLA